MAVQFRSIRREDLLPLSQFLLDVFKLPSSAIFIQPNLLDWKYFTPGPLSAGPRSHLLLKDDQIAAHGCIAPFDLSYDGHAVSSMQIIDWASGGAVPGGGLLLYRNCLALRDTLVAIGGSDDTRQLISLLKWFRPLEPIRLFARPLRPVRQIAASRSELKRDTGRLVRSIAWSFWPPVPSSNGWTCRLIPRFTRTAQVPGAHAGLVRSPEWLNYLLGCPVAAMQACELWDRDEWRGHVLLSSVGHQTRVADLAVETDRAEDWRCAVSSILRLLRNRSEVFEVVAGSSLDFVCRALEECGLQPRGTVPAYLADPKKHIPPGTRIELNLAIGDAFYLPDQSRPFWT